MKHIMSGSNAKTTQIGTTIIQEGVLMKKQKTVTILLLAALLLVSMFPNCNAKAESSVKTPN